MQVALTELQMHRVKVYKLNSEGTWEDKGTGHISVEYMEVRGARMQTQLSTRPEQLHRGAEAQVVDDMCTRYACHRFNRFWMKHLPYPACTVLHFAESTRYGSDSHLGR